jgi:hypothetical protein
VVRDSLGTLYEIVNWNSSTSIYAVAVVLVAIAGVARVAYDDGLGARPPAIACNVTVIDRWTPSERNCADQPSRVFED